MKKYAIFTSNNERGKCLAIFETKEEAEENLLNPDYEKYTNLTIFLCTEKQRIGSRSVK